MQTLDNNILNKMKQCIRFSDSRVSEGVFKIYTNDTMCYEKDNDWKYLISIGYATIMQSTDSYFHYSLTDQGIKYLEDILGISIVKDLR